MGKVHGSLARAGKVRGQTPKVAKQDKKKQPRGRAHKRIQYNRRFVTAVVGFGKKREMNLHILNVSAAQLGKKISYVMSQNKFKAHIDYMHGCMHSQTGTSQQTMTVSSLIPNKSTTMPVRSGQTSAATKLLCFGCTNLTIYTCMPKSTIAATCLYERGCPAATNTFFSESTKQHTWFRN
nr:40S ribosomal protein S30 [Tanacetum cinerariifolium]